MIEARHDLIEDPAELITPFERRVADLFLADPQGGNSAAAYRQACDEMGVVPGDPNAAPHILKRPMVAEYLRRRRKELAAAVYLTQERVLMDLMELREMCMGRKPMPMASFHEGELVTGAAHKLDAPGAAKTLELLGRYLAMWTDNVNQTGGTQQPALFVLNLNGQPDALPPPPDAAA